MNEGLPADPEAALDEIEAWFVDRGMPHLIADYNAAEDVFTRAVPALTLVFLLELSVAMSLDWTWWQNVLAVAGASAIVVGIWAGVNRLRGRRALARPSDVGFPELAVFVLGPAVAAAAFGQATQGAGLVASNLALLGIVYAVTSYGLVPLTTWATARTFRELGELAGLLSRALPLLLLFVTFLFINTEVWQVAEALEWEAFAASVGLFVVVGMLFLLTRLPGEVERLAHFDGDAEVDDACRGTPAESIALALDDLDGPPPPLSRRQRANVMLVVLFAEGVQIVLVGLMVFAFFVAFGLVAIRPDVIAAWVGDAALGEDVATFTLFGHDTVLTAALLRVAAFLGAFSAFYFTVYVVTDEAYRVAFLDDLLVEMRQTFAVRATYLAYRTRSLSS